MIVLRLNLNASTCSCHQNVFGEFFFSMPKHSIDWKIWILEMKWNEIYEDNGNEKINNAIKHHLSPPPFPKKTVVILSCWPSTVNVSQGPWMCPHAVNALHELNGTCSALDGFHVYLYLHFKTQCYSFFTLICLFCPRFIISATFYHANLSTASIISASAGSLWYSLPL